MRTAALALALVLATGATTAVAAEPPVLRVRARARVHLDEVVADASGVTVTGAVLDARLRSGVPGKEVTVEARRWGRVERRRLTADAHGRFQGRLALPQGRYRIRVLADADDRYGAARSAERRLDLAQPIPRRWLLFPFAVTALLLVAAGVVRLRPWHRRRPGTATASADRRLESGLAAARPGPFGALRPRDDTVFSGSVVDVHAAAPLPGATIEARLRGHPGAAAVVACSDARGHFAFPGLAAGHHEVSVGAPGYVTERFDITVPHRGELRGARIDLVPVRVRILEVYRDVALGLLPDRDLLWVWTPRELLAGAPASLAPREADDPLPRLTYLVEDSFYSGRPSEETRLDEARRLAARCGDPGGV